MTKSLYGIEYDFSFSVEIDRIELEVEKQLEKVTGYKDKNGNPVIVYKEERYGLTKTKIFVGEKEIYLSELQERWDKFVYAERCGRFLILQPREINTKPVLKYIETIYRDDWAGSRLSQLKHFLKEELDIELVLYKE